MERRSEIVEGLETLREAILGYDAAADTKGAAWDELRVELDRSVLALIEKAGRMLIAPWPVRVDAAAGPAVASKVYGGHAELDALGQVKAGAEVRHVAGVDLALKGGDATGVQVVRVENNTLTVEPSIEVKLEGLTAFRRDLPATWMVIMACTVELDADLKFDVDATTGTHTFWGESERGRDFIAAKLKVRARIGKHYRIGRPFDVVMKSHPKQLDIAVRETPYRAGEGPAEVDPRACLVTPLTEAGSIWLQNQAADGVTVLHKGKSLVEVEARPPFTKERVEAVMAHASAAASRPVYGPGVILDPPSTPAPKKTRFQGAIDKWNEEQAEERTRARIGKLYRVPVREEAAKAELGEDADVTLSLAPHDAGACHVRPKTMDGSRWIQRQADAGLTVVLVADDAAP